VKPSLLYRIAAVLIVLFDAGHTSGYPWSDPKWAVDLTAMQSTHFDVFGASRTYWDFYVGFGLLGSVFLVLAAVLAWQLGGLPPDTLARLRVTTWIFPLCFAAIAILAWKFIFIIPVVFSIAITLCLIGAAVLAKNQG
jgi:hypothetical protein